MTKGILARDLVKGGLFLTGGAAVQAIAAFAAQLVLMRRLSPETFGQFATVLAGCGLVQVVLSLRVNVLIIRTPDDCMTPELRQRFNSVLFWETLLAALATLAWQTASGLLSPLSCVLVVSLALNQWIGQALAFYERSLPYRNIATIEAAAQLVGHSAAVVLVMAGAGASSLYLRELIVNLVRLGAFLRRGAVRFERIRWLGLEEWRALLHEARDVWVDGIVDSGFSRLVVLASGAVGGLGGAGLFSQAQRLALVPHQLFSPVLVRMTANLFARTEDGLRRWRMLGRLSAWALAGLSVAAVAAVAFSDPVVPWLFGEHWRPAARVLQGLAGAIVFFSTFDLLRAYCISQRLTWIVVVARLVQYPLFGAAALIAGRSDEPVISLAVGFSVVYGAATALIGLGLLRNFAAGAAGQCRASTSARTRSQ